MSQKQYDLIVLGGGPGGYRAAERAGALGKSVLLVEKSHLGGVCLNRGCIPTKSLLHSAKLYKRTLEGEQFGLKADFEERNVSFFADPAASNAKVKLFWIGAGNNDQMVGDGERQLCEALRSHGIAHEFHESEGGHTWINWRRYLYDFVQRLFR